MKRTLIILLLCAAALTHHPVEAQDTLTADSLTAVSSVAVFNPDMATQVYLNTLSSEEKERSDRYFEGGYWLILWGMIMEIIVAILFLFTGLSRWMIRISERVRKIAFQQLIYIVMYLLFAFLITLPYSIVVDFIREKHFGLMNLSFGGWMKEELIGLALSLVALSPLLLLIYYTIRKSGERWWIWASGVSIVFIILFIFVYPLFIAPLFNEYKELPDSELKKEILSLARANSIPTEHVYQFDASKQTDRVSANVSGMGSTIRISLNDNLLNRCNNEEIKAVMAHEMGHYVLNHVSKYILSFSVLLILGFALTHIIFKRICGKWGHRLHISGIADIGGLPLFVVILSFLIFLSTPLINNLSRKTEVEADIFGLNAAREPDGFAGAIMLTTEYRKADPGHWEEIIFYDHPSPKSRIDMAMRWKAENLKE